MTEYLGGRKFSGEFPWTREIVKFGLRFSETKLIDALHILLANNLCFPYRACAIVCSCNHEFILGLILKCLSKLKYE
jgi:hypothetical protein